MKTSCFTKEFGSYYFRVNGNIVYMCDEISVAFDKESLTIQKYGPKDSVDVWARGFREKAVKVGFANLVDNLVIVSSRDWDLGVLNSILGQVTLPLKLIEWWRSVLTK